MVIPMRNNRKLIPCLVVLLSLEVAISVTIHVSCSLHLCFPIYL